MSGGEAETLAFYDREAAAYADSERKSDVSETLERFTAELPDGAAVMDLGCGGGWSSIQMAEAGFAVTPVDGSAGLAAEAEARTGLKVRVARFDEIEDVAAFDGIWASYSLHHIPRDELPDALRRIARALKPGGAFFIGVKGGEGEARDKLGRFYTYYRADALQGLLAAAGLQPLWTEESEGTGFDDEPCLLVEVIARKKEDAVA